MAALGEIDEDIALLQSALEDEEASEDGAPVTTVSLASPQSSATTRHSPPGLSEPPPAKRARRAEDSIGSELDSDLALLRGLGLSDSEEEVAGEEATQTTGEGRETNDPQVAQALQCVQLNMALEEQLQGFLQVIQSALGSVRSDIEATVAIMEGRAPQSGQEITTGPPRRLPGTP